MAKQRLAINLVLPNKILTKVKRGLTYFLFFFYKELLIIEKYLEMV